MKKLIITGNVGRNPETNTDPQGNEFVVFSVGISVGTKQNPKTDWVDVICNGKLAEFARNYIQKGGKLLIEGFPTVHAYINKEGKAVGVQKLYANNIELLGKPNSNNEPENNSEETISASSDNIPF